MQRNINQLSILDLVSCADDYGHNNDVCMWSLYEWAKPITDNDIKRYAATLKNKDGFKAEDRRHVVEELTKWRNKYLKIESK